jgi:phage-related protein
MSKTVRLICSPVDSNLEVVEGLVIKLHIPYSNEEVTVKVNPNITDYAECQNDNVRQVMQYEDTDETKTLKFDFEDNNTQRVEFDNKIYEIKLMGIGKVNKLGQDFPAFDFLVSIT